jgi:hypothetical protein
VTLETIARVPAGLPVERVLAHPRLPLLACFDAGRPAVHVLDHEGGRLAAIGAETAAYNAAAPWERFTRTPAAAWHPREPLLVVSGESGMTRWTPGEMSTRDSARYHSVALSPDGAALWASPSSSAEPTAWNRSDVVDLASGTVGSGPQWDTGVAEHPAGGLVATLRSNQGLTLVVFAEPGAGIRSRALVLDADGYGPPMFSPDGQYLAIAGNAYENLLQVFEFPSLRRVLATGLGARQAVAFAAGALWIGVPEGSLAGIDLDGGTIVEHSLPGSPVTALAATATGELIAAAGRELVLLGRATAEPEPDPSRVAGFLAMTTEVSDEDDLDEVPATLDPEPAWLRLQTALDARSAP